MTVFAHERIVDVLNSLLMVEWDRMIEHEWEGRDGDPLVCTTVYGWISRGNGHRDFVVLEFSSWDRGVGVTTSSAAFSKAIHDTVNPGDGVSEHRECVSVGRVLGDAVKRKVSW